MAPQLLSVCVCVGQYDVMDHVPQLLSVCVTLGERPLVRHDTRSRIAGKLAAALGRKVPPAPPPTPRPAPPRIREFISRNARAHGNGNLTAAPPSPVALPARGGVDCPSAHRSRVHCANCTCECQVCVVWVLFVECVWWCWRWSVWVRVLWVLVW